MHRVAQLPKLEATWSWTYLDATNRKRELPAPDDVAAFWAAADNIEETGRMLLGGDRKTWHALVARYKDSDAYACLIKSMQDQYNRYAKVIEAAWGDAALYLVAPPSQPLGCRPSYQRVRLSWKRALGMQRLRRP